jgi:hypothetical protein
MNLAIRLENLKFMIMKSILNAILIGFLCINVHSQQRNFFPPAVSGDPERFKAPDYNPMEDSLLRMNHYMTEIWDPEVIKVKPGKNFTEPPSDAIILFNGKDPDKEWHETVFNFQDGKTSTRNVTCEIKDGALYPPKGFGQLTTNRNFKDFQLHIEWMILPDVKGTGQARGNGGVYLQGLYEIQIMDSYGTRTYKNGQAGALYKQYAPLVNANLPPGEWQSYDIIYTAPRFGDDSTLYFTQPRVTIFQNGILIQNNVALRGPTTWVGLPETMIRKHGAGPIMLQNRNALAFRNIWIREL